jgi:hypothetical protein
MAEALALFGGGAAALSLVKDLCDISVSLYNCCKTLRYARKEIRDVAKETDLFSGLLLEFCGVAEKAPEDNFSSKGTRKEQKLFKKLANRCKSILRDLRKLMKKVEVLEPDTTATTLSRGLARLRWLFEKDSVKCLYASLSASKESMGIFIALRTLNELREMRKMAPEKEKELTQRMYGLKVLNSSLCKGLKFYREILERRITSAVARSMDAEKIVLEYGKQKGSAGLQNFVENPYQLRDLTTAMRDYAQDSIDQRNLQSRQRRNRGERRVGSRPQRSPTSSTAENFEENNLQPVQQANDLYISQPTQPTEPPQRATPVDRPDTTSSKLVKLPRNLHDQQQRSATPSEVSRSSSSSSMKIVENLISGWGREYRNDDSGDILSNPKRRLERGSMELDNNNSCTAQNAHNEHERSVPKQSRYHSIDEASVIARTHRLATTSRSTIHSCDSKYNCPLCRDTNDAKDHSK